MSKTCIENKEFCFKLVLDTIFRTSKSLEQTIIYYFIVKIHNGVE